MLNLVFYFQALFSINYNSFCLCRPISLEENFNNSTVVFSGKVLQVDTVKLFDEGLPKDAFRELLLATIARKESYKGSNLSDTVYLMTGAGYGDCGYDFKLNTRYIFYTKEATYELIDSINLTTHEFHTSKKSYLSTTVCDRTTSDLKKESRLLKQFLAKKKTRINKHFK